jgi:hypothetical protein
MYKLNKIVASMCNPKLVSETKINAGITAYNIYTFRYEYVIHQLSLLGQYKNDNFRLTQDGCITICIITTGLVRHILEAAPD